MCAVQTSGTGFVQLRGFGGGCGPSSSVSRSTAGSHRVRQHDKENSPLPRLGKAKFNDYQVAPLIDGRIPTADPWCLSKGRGPVLRLHRVRHGWLAHFDDDTTIGQSIAQYGEWAENEIFLLSRFVNRGSTVLDIGANVGTHSLALRRMLGAEGRLISIDAQHHIFTLLAANMALNGYYDVNCLNLLVGSNLRVDFVPSPDAKTATNYGAVSFTEEARASLHAWKRLPIGSITIDSLELDSCDLIKADVEGMELEVFSGSVKTLERCRPVVYFEQTGQKKLRELIEIFERADYKLYWHVANPFNSNNFKGSRQNIFGGTCEVNIVGLPAEKSAAMADGMFADYPVLSSDYAPPSQVDALSGWPLPLDAYQGLEPAIGLLDGALPSRSSNDEELGRMQKMYDDLAKDRLKAQEIMEYQHEQIKQLRRQT